MPVLEIAGPTYKVNLFTHTVWEEPENLVFL
jgi:hypothetical protein